MTKPRTPSIPPLFTSCTTGIRFCKASPWTSRSTCTSWAKWKRSSLSSDSAKSKCIRRTISSRPPQMKRKCSFLRALNNAVLLRRKAKNAWAARPLPFSPAPFGFFSTSMRGNRLRSAQQPSFKVKHKESGRTPAAGFSRRSARFCCFKYTGRLRFPHRPQFPPGCRPRRCARPPRRRPAPCQ